MRKYSRKQISEAIKYWSNQLKRMDEATTQCKTYEVVLGDAHYDFESGESGDFSLDYDLETQEVEAKNEREAFDIAVDEAKKKGWGGFKFNEATIAVVEDDED